MFWKRKRRRSKKTETGSSWDYTEYHPALQGWSFDHEKAIAISDGIQQALDGTYSDLQKACSNSLDFWAKNGAFHLWEEEHVLLPILHRRLRLSSDRDIQQMLEDHAYLRSQIHIINSFHLTRRPYDKLLGDFGRILRCHVHLEETQIFPKLSEHLSADDLTELAILAECHRQAMGRPAPPHDQAPLQFDDSFPGRPSSP